MTVNAVVLARAQLVVEVRRKVDREPGQHPELEIALRRIYEAERAHSRRKAELNGVIRARTPIAGWETDPPKGAA